MVRRCSVSPRAFSRRTNARGAISPAPSCAAASALALRKISYRAACRRFFAIDDTPAFARAGSSTACVTRVHRALDLELTVGLSGGLLEALDAGELDLVLAKRRPGEDRGQLVRREK